MSLPDYNQLRWGKDIPGEDLTQEEFDVLYEKPSQQACLVHFGRDEYVE
jgi:hypothetical protein